MEILFKYLILHLTTLFIFRSYYTTTAIAVNAASVAAAASNRKQGSKQFYFSDLMKYIETNSKTTGNSNNNNNNNNNLDKLNPMTSSNSKTSNNNNKFSYPNRTSTWNDDSNNNYDDDEESSYHNHPNRQCRPNIQIYRVKIGENQCQPLDYSTVECRGYCSSRTMLWKDTHEVAEVSCCTIEAVHEKTLNLYCLSPVDMNSLVYNSNNNEADNNNSDTNQLNIISIHPKPASQVVELFKEALISSPWTEHYSLIGDRLYSGYYSVSIVHSAKCRCELIN